MIIELFYTSILIVIIFYPMNLSKVKKKMTQSAIPHLSIPIRF